MDRVKLILLVGIPGSGKSTYADGYVMNYFNTVHLSSDKIREELWGNEATQGDNGMIFSIMQSRAIEALRDGKSVIYDATNVTRKDRSYIIDICPKFVQIEAHVVWAPIQTCIERDASRERTVGQAVIDKMLKRFQPPFYDEGFDDIKVVLPDGFNNIEHTFNVINAMKIPHDNPHHTNDIHDHCMAAYLYACENSMNSDVKFSALYHDIGKPYTKAFIDSHGNACDTAHYYSHHNVSAWLAYGVKDTSIFRVWMIGNHMEPFFNTKYYKNMPSSLKNNIDILHECDLNAH